MHWATGLHHPGEETTSPQVHSQQQPFSPPPNQHNAGFYCIDFPFSLQVHFNLILPFLPPAKWNQDFLGGSDGNESACQAGDPGSIPGSGRFPWRRDWQPTPVFSPGDSHGWKNLMGYSPWGCKESDKTEQLTFSHSLNGINHTVVFPLASSLLSPSWSIWRLPAVVCCLCWFLFMWSCLLPCLVIFYLCQYDGQCIIFFPGENWELCCAFFIQRSFISLWVMCVAPVSHWQSAVPLI